MNYARTKDRVQGEHPFTLGVFQKWILDYFLMYGTDDPTLGAWMICKYTPNKGLAGSEPSPKW